MGFGSLLKLAVNKDKKDSIFLQVKSEPFFAYTPCYRTPLRQMVLFFTLLKRINCKIYVPTFSNDLFARDQNHEKKHHPPWSIAFVFQVSCSMHIYRKRPCEPVDL